MSKIEIKYPKGATPLDPNEMEGLIPSYLSTHAELNLLERENILEAVTWAHGRKHKTVLETKFIHDLHKRMFSRVWKWAGKPRRSDKNIGVSWSQIANQMAHLLKDTHYWIENKTYPWDEIGARFHHKLVWIHIFPNGNGRHARLLTDILMQTYDQDPFTWGLKNASEILDVEGKLRDHYIHALKDADAKNFDRLMKFVRT